MNPFNEQLKNEVRRTRLSAEEKALMRTFLVREMKTHPLSVSVPTPYFSYRNMLRGRSLRKTVPAALIIALLTSTGVSYAAEGSLPGDVLYPVKIHVNESLRSTLARSDAAKAKVDADMATRRLVEAERLKQEGRLDQAAKNELKINFEEHHTNAGKHLRALGETDKEDAERISVQMRTRFIEHQDAMDELDQQWDHEESNGHDDTHDGGRRTRERSFDVESGTPNMFKNEGQHMNDHEMEKKDDTKKEDNGNHEESLQKGPEHANETAAVVLGGNNERIPVRVGDGKKGDEKDHEDRSHSEDSSYSGHSGD